MKNWYSKMLFGNGEEPYCPNCKALFIFGPIFDHDKRECLKCGIELREWNLSKGVYIINPAEAPELIKNIIDYLDKFTEYEACDHLLSLEEFFENE